MLLFFQQLEFDSVMQKNEELEVESLYYIKMKRLNSFYSNTIVLKSS